MENLEFKNISVAEFNGQYGTQLKADMNFSDACDIIEDEANNIWYVSLDKNDVIEDFNECKNDASLNLSKFNIEYYLINELGIYIGIY